MADLNVAIRLSATDQASPVIGKVTREVAGIGAAADTSSTKVGGLTSVLGKVGLAAMGIGAVATAVGGLGKALIDPIMAASDLDESMNKVNVVFGSSAKTVTDFAKTAASGLGQSERQALAAAGTFGNLFTSMGLGQKDAAKLSTEVVTLASDLASFNNLAPEEVLEKLRAGLVGEAEPLRSLGVNLTEASVAEEALRLGLGKSAKTLTEGAKIRARYSLITKQAANAQGDFGETSSGMANSIRIINASLDNLQTQIGRRLLPVIAPLVANFAKLLPQALDALGPILDRVGGFAKGFADGLGRLVENVRTKGLLPALGELGREILPTLQQAFSKAGDLAGSLAAWLRDQVSKIDWGAVWAGATGAVGAIASWLGRQWASVDWVGIWRQAVGIGRGLLGSGLALATDAATWLGQQWARIDWAGIWAQATSIGSGLVSSGLAIATDAATWLAAQWAKIDWTGVWASAVTMGKGLIDSGLSIWGSATDWLTAQWAKIDWAPAWKAVQGVGVALERNLEPVTRPLERWLTASMRDIDLSAVIRDAMVGPRTASSLEDMYRHEDSLPVGRAIGYWLGNAFLDGIDIVVGFLRGDGADRLGVGIAAALVRGFANAGPASAAAARTFGLDVGVAIVGGVVQAIADRLLPGIRRAIDAAMTGLAPTMQALTPPGGAPMTMPRGGGSGSVPAMQHGGIFRVGGSGGVDSRMVAFRATPGEVVAVGHARRGDAGGATVVNQTFHVANRSDAEYLADVLPDALARALEKARSQQGLPVVSGLTRFN